MTQQPEAPDTNPATLAENVVIISSAMSYVIGRLGRVKEFAIPLVEAWARGSTKSFGRGAIEDQEVRVPSRFAINIRGLTYEVTKGGNHRASESLYPTTQLTVEVRRIGWVIGRVDLEVDSIEKTYARMEVFNGENTYNDPREADRHILEALRL